jgi:hypothetical protein
MLYRTALATFITVVSAHSISIGPRVRRKHGRLPSNALIERASSTVPAFTYSRERASD